jgi:hypothetical protein
MFNGFHRYFGYPKRVKIENMKELSRLIDEHDGCNPCFLSVSHYKDDKPYLGYIPFDFDGKDERVLKDTNKLMIYFWLYGIPYDIKISGRRGMHVVIPLEFNPKEPRFISPKTMMSIQMHCVDKLGLETFDYHLNGNLSALLRIPYTINEKSKKFCIPIRSCNAQKISIDNILDKLNVKEFKFDYDNNYDLTSEVHPYPCLETFIRVPNPSNYCRLAFAVYRYHQGAALSDIYSELENMNWKDWKPDKAKYHLFEIKQKGYSMPTCQTIDNYGLCFGCKYDDRKIFKKIKVHNRNV